MSASCPDEASKVVLWHARNSSKPVKLVKFDPRAGGRQGGGDNLSLRRNSLILQIFLKHTWIASTFACVLQKIWYYISFSPMSGSRKERLDG
jgi:hypothetical protein